MPDESRCPWCFCETYGTYTSMTGSSFREFGCGSRVAEIESKQSDLCKLRQCRKLLEDVFAAIDKHGLEHLEGCPELYIPGFKDCTCGRDQRLAALRDRWLGLANESRLAASNQQKVREG